MIRALAILALVAPLAAGCGSDCADATRVNGTYAMWHSITNLAADEGGASVNADYPSYQVFANGWSKWKLTYQSADGTLNADITDVAEVQGDFNEGGALAQSYAGTLTSAEDNCNVFALHLEGDFETSADTVHTFVYDATLVYLGDHLNGTHAYSDTYVSSLDGSTNTGGLTGAEGDANGTLQVEGGGFDTGFLD